MGSDEQVQGRGSIRARPHTFSQMQCMEREDSGPGSAESVPIFGERNSHDPKAMLFNPRPGPYVDELEKGPGSDRGRGKQGQDLGGGNDIEDRGDTISTELCRKPELGGTQIIAIGKGPL